MPRRHRPRGVGLAEAVPQGEDAADVAGVVPRRRLREPMRRRLIFHRTRMLLIRIVPPFDSVAAARAVAVATLLRLRPRLIRASVIHEVPGVRSSMLSCCET